MSDCLTDFVRVSYALLSCYTVGFADTAADYMYSSSKCRMHTNNRLNCLKCCTSFIGDSSEHIWHLSNGSACKACEDLPMQATTSMGNVYLQPPAKDHDTKLRSK